MEFLVHRRGNTVVVDVPQTLVVGNRQELKQLILAPLERGTRQFVVDLRRTTYVDSAGLGALIVTRKKVVAEGGEMWLANVNDDMRRLLSLTKLDTFLPLLDDSNDGDGDVTRPASRGTRVPGPLTSSPDAELPPPSDFA
jgi:anti-sigma B factor antagonist